MIKKILFSFILLLSTSSLFAQDNNYAVINFIGDLGMRKLYLNDQLITSFGNEDIVRFKIYSKGRITITYLSEFDQSESSIEIKENKDYYYLGGRIESVNHINYKNTAIDKKTFELIEFQHERILEHPYNIIELEENKDYPIGKIPSTDYEGPKQGACFLISKQGYFLTNYHVISGAKNVQVKGIGNDFSTLYGVDVVAFDIDLDLALLKLKNQNITFQDVPYSLNIGATVLQGTKVFMLGYPLTSKEGEEIKVSEGIISSESGYKGTISQYQFSAAIEPDNSGNPLFSDSGEVIGIVKTKLDGIEGEGYAIKSQYVYIFLKLIKNIQIENNIVSLSNLSLNEMVTKIKDNIFIIKCE